MPLVPYEEAVGYERIKGGYKQALRGRRKYTREAVKYDLFREKNNVDLWRELKSSKYTPGPYHFNVITEPKRRDLSIPQLRDKVVQLVIHEELQSMFRPVFINGSFACQYGRGPIRAAFKVQHDMRVARMKWGDQRGDHQDRRPESSFIPSTALCSRKSLRSGSRSSRRNARRPMRISSASIGFFAK